MGTLRSPVATSASRRVYPGGLAGGDEPLRSRYARRGFTLVEMLVVLVLILALSAIAVAVIPSLNERERAARGADQLQGVLLIAKQRALRDQAPRGIQLVSTGSPQVRELQFVEQPADLVYRSPSGVAKKILITDDPRLYVTGLPAWVTQLIDVKWRANGITNYSWVVLEAGAGNDFASGEILQGDYLEVKNGGVHRIVHQVLDAALFTNDPPPPAMTAQSGIVNGRVLLLASPFTYSLGETVDYRIIRSPRVLVGETPVQLPVNVAIDLSRSLNVPQDNNIPYIMFGPGGGVVGRGTGAGNIVLWVYDTNKDPGAPGAQFLIVINVRTGLIAAHPVDESGPDPYSFTRDGRSSGL